MSEFYEKATACLADKSGSYLGISSLRGASHGVFLGYHNARVSQPVPFCHMIRDFVALQLGLITSKSRRKLIKEVFQSSSRQRRAVLSRLYRVLTDHDLGPPYRGKPS